MAVELTSAPTDTPATNDVLYFNDVSETPDALNQCTLAAVQALFAASTTEVLTGTETLKNVTPDALAALWEQGSNIASASTISVGEGGYFFVTGTTTITDIDFATDKAGRRVWLKFNGALQITHNATTLINIGGANITTAAGDVACFVSEGTDNVRMLAYFRAASLPATIAGTETLTNKTFVAPVLGAATATSVAATGALTSSGTAGVGYATGAGGTVTQATSKSTGVTLNKICGAITMNNAALASGASVSFTVTNSTIAATDVPWACYKSGAAGSGADYDVKAHTPGAGSFIITVKNVTGGSLSEAIVINFGIIKAVAA